MDNNWVEWTGKLENGIFYELCFWQRAVHYVSGLVVEGSFVHQGILMYDDGFKVDGYWLRPTPTHVRRIELTTPCLSEVLDGDREE